MLPGRALEEIDAFTRCADRLAAHEFRGLQLVLSMREDYLGRFRDHARGHRLLLEHGFRLGPFTVREITKAVLEAARAGEPPQLWPKEQTRDLMLQMRTPGQRERDDAEVQAAFVQIVCRALWEARREESEGGSLPASMARRGSSRPRRSCSRTSRTRSRRSASIGRRPCGSSIRGSSPRTARADC